MKLVVQIKKKLEHLTLDVNFSVEDETFALLGASGAGKSMTLKCIAGIETPDEGRIELDGEILFDSEKRINLPPQKRRVGYLFQEYALFPHMNVEQNINIVTSHAGRTEELLQRFSIEDIQKKYPSEISGGQKQRVALARMMAGNPKVILLDEPFSALDIQSKNDVVRNTEKLILDAGAIPLLVTHHFDEVARLADKVVCINEGKTETVQEVESFFRKPQTKTAALLLGCKNITECKKNGENGTMLLKDWGICIPGEKSCMYVGIREDGFSLQPKEEMYPVSVDHIELGEDIFWWHVYLFCSEKEGIKPIYCRFRKELYQRSDFNQLTEIYLDRKAVSFLN